MMNKLHTLIVDDEAELRRSVISILKSAMPEIDFTIEEASTGKEALEKVKAQQWDLVFNGREDARDEWHRSLECYQRARPSHLRGFDDGTFEFARCRSGDQRRRL